MEQKYKKKLELTKKLLHDSQNVGPSEEAEKMFDDGHALMEELVQTKDTEVLCELMDLFNEELDLTGVCETLESEIFQNFTMEQIIEVLYKKLFTLVANNEMRAVGFAGACLNTGYFRDFRNIFNSAKSPNSEDFLNEFEKWYDEDYPKEIAILREDLKKW
jgi:hypothetical protein